MAGVCAGLARRIGIQPVVLRVIAVILAIAFGGLGIALYAAGMLLIPREGETYGLLQRAIPAMRRWPTGLLVGLAIAASVIITAGTGGGPILVPAAVIGLVLWFGVHRPRQAAPRTLEPTPFERAADAWRVRLAEQQVPGFEVAETETRWQQPYTDASDRLVADSPVALPAEIKPRRNWRLWWVALALAGSGVAAVTLLGLAFGLPTTPLAYFSAVLAALGVTALVGARFGRPPLLVSAIILTAAMTATQLFPAPGVVGDVSQAYTQESELPAEVDVAVGDVNLNFANLALTSDRTITVKVGVGDVALAMPEHQLSTLDWKVGIGTANYGPLDLKTDVSSKTLTGGPEGATGPTLTVIVDVGTGNLEVTP